MDFIKEGFKGRIEWYWYLITLGIVFFFWQIIGIIPLVAVASVKAGSVDKFVESAKDQFMSLGIDSNLYLFLALFTLISGLLGLLLGVKYIHNRFIKNIITSRSAVDWSRIGFAFMLWFMISLGILMIGVFVEPENLVWNFKPIPFAILVIISFLLIPLQTSFEELLFRGYLMQGLGVLAKNRWLPLLLTSIVFGLLHGANPEVEKLGWGIMVFYIGTGLFFGIVTLMDEGTELALGLHAANNIVAAVFITTDWAAFQTEALYIDTSEPSLGWETFVPVFVLYPIILYILSRKYGWKDWNQKLFGKVNEPELIV
jgi:hypothetical protein